MCVRSGWGMRAGCGEQVGQGEQRHRDTQVGGLEQGCLSGRSEKAGKSPVVSAHFPIQS